MKKNNNKPNPLKFFNDNKTMAYKQAGGAIKSRPVAKRGGSVKSRKK